jgi:hypothetical protein
MASGVAPTGGAIPPNLGPKQVSPTMAAPVKVPGPAAGARPSLAKQTMMGMGLSPQPNPGAPALRPLNTDDEDESTVIGKAPTEILAAASGAAKAVSDETAEWMGVYDEFLRTKKQCDEPTEGLSFEKFQNTLRKNRDALVQRHQCKRVRFSVYVKDGRASLKATPVKE